MSLAETQELMATMKELMALLGQVEQKTAKISAEMPQTKQAIMTKRELFKIISELNTIFAVMGLPKEIPKAISVMQRAIFIANALYISISAIEKGTMIGRAVGILGFIGVAASTLEGY